MAETRCKYYKQKKQVSYDGGQTWQDVIPYQYQRGELYEHESTDCGALVVYRWVNMDASVDYYCEGTTKYYKQKKQVSYDGGQTWIYVSPAEYQRGGVAEQRSTDCGYVPPTPQYRWIKSDDTICVEILYRWVNMDASVDYYCEGTTKYYKQKKQISLDDGQTWQDVTPPVYQKGDVAEAQSTDCGYIPPIPTNKKFVGTYSDGKTLEVECNEKSTLTRGETRPSGYDRYSMTGAVIGDCVTTIGTETFWGCHNLKRVNSNTDGVCIIPNGIIGIGHTAFANCYSLTSVIIPDSVTIIGNTIYYADGAFAGCSGLTSVTIGNSVQTIGRNAFSDCTGLTSVVMPDSVIVIGDAAFYYCSGLTSVTISNRTTNISRIAFEGCSGLISVVIPDSTTVIGEYAFAHCSGLMSITCLATTPPSLPDSSGAIQGSHFYDTNNCPILVPASSVNAYKSAWSQYASRIQAIP